MRDFRALTALRRRAWRATLGVTLLAAGAAAAGAQDAARRDVIQGAGATPDFTRPKRGGFDLFATGDLAGTGMKMTGQFGWGLSNLGPCADGFAIFQCGDVFNRNAYRFQIFEVLITAGAPVSEFIKIQQAHGGIRTAVRGGGYTHLMNFALFAGRSEVGPKDGTLGSLFRGEPSTEDGSCRDNSSALNGYMSTGVSLLAGSTCPDTWGPAGFQGPRSIEDVAFIRAFEAQPDSFRFDWWRIPQSEIDQNSVLGDFATYGEMTDHYAEIVQSYGGVTRLGSGPATIGGYPLGLDMRFEAFSFALPQIANAVFWQMTVVNKSELLYGSGIDYDSLYMGLSLGFGGNQANNLYYEPWSNAVKAAQVGVNVNCNGAINPNGVPACARIGFLNGAVGVIGLKSPIGDTRNKLLTRSGPFFNPTSQFADDTITFNHGHMCGFGGCWANTINVNDRRGFGLVSSTPDNVLDGVSPGSFGSGANGDFWLTFRNKDFPTRTAKFNNYVPGNVAGHGQWDYNNDGQQDTLFFDTCAEGGCVTTWADTLPGKQVNRYSNVGGMMTAGPFKLGAGDTTSFVWAFIGAPDSASYEALVAAVTDAYNSFYLTPKPPPTPSIVAVDVEHTRLRETPQVRLFLSDDPERWVDPFLTKFANDLETTTDPALSRIRALNPGLADQIRERAQDNFAEMLIFKSCDGGATFTSATPIDCQGDPAVDVSGRPLGSGWQAYAVLRADASGNFPKVFTDANVIGGRTFLYSVATRSKGFTTTIRDSLDGEEITRVFTVADTIGSALARSGPNTARVYVPISLPTGAMPATVAVTRAAGTATVPVEVQFGQRVTGGTFDMVFGNSFIVTTVTDTATDRVISSSVRVRDIFAAERGGVVVPGGFVRQDQTFNGTTPVEINGTLVASDDSLDGGNRITTEEISGTGFVLVDQNGKPYFVSTTLLTGTTTPATFPARADFPGFIINVNNDAASLTSTTLYNELVVSADSRDTLGGGILNGAGFPGAVVNTGGVQLQEGITVRRNGAAGKFAFRFADDSYNGQLFNLDWGPDSLQRAVRNALIAREDASVGDTTAATKAAISAAITAYAGRRLVAAKFPFSVYDSTRGVPATLAMVARRALATPRTDSLPLGANVDTARVAIPEDEWVPGDEFVVLETVTRDSVAGGRLVLSETTGEPIQVTGVQVVLGPVTLGCNTPRTACNPIEFGTRGQGSTQYLRYEPDYSLIVEYLSPFTPASQVRLAVTPPQPTGGQVTRRALSDIRVVPNPFIYQSAFDEIQGDGTGVGRVMFTGLPATGSLRIYSVSGQFLQELSWTAADLNGTGDLPYNLRTREGTDLAAGLYIYVIRTQAGGREQTTRGKFVVIR